MTKQLATKTENVPAFIQSKDIRGSEGAGMDDIIIPSITLLQSLSPELDSDGENYIQEAKAGDIINNVTGEIYGRGVNVVPVVFEKQYVVFKDRMKGGGFHGSFRTKGDAVAAVNELEGMASDYVVSDVASRVVLVVNADGTYEQAIIRMSSTKLKCSRKWMSIVRMTEQDSFARVYTIESVKAESPKGRYYTFGVKAGKYVTEDIYHAAEALYETITAGDASFKASGEHEDF